MCHKWIRRARRKKEYSTSPCYKYDKAKDKDKDVYICLAGETLQNLFRSNEKGVELDVYFNNTACSHCEIRAKCSTSAKNQARQMRR
jgi:hypothetical protein